MARLYVFIGAARDPPLVDIFQRVVWRVDTGAMRFKHGFLSDVVHLYLDVSQRLAL